MKDNATGRVLLELSHASKSYPGVKALSDASLTCYAGEVHALVGENGSGKSTLVKIASGTIAADSGDVHVDGNILTKSTPVSAKRLGLLTAYQDTALVPQLSVAENLLLSYHGVRKLPRVVRASEADELLAPFELPFHGDARVSDLSPGARQLFEVVRAMVHQPKVLILDEPTAALDMNTAATLEKLVSDFVARGSAVLYVTHRLAEVRRLAARVTIIRDGEIQETFHGSDWNVDDLVTMMVGVPTDLEFPDKASALNGQPGLEVQDLTGRALGPISISVRPREIVGIAGAEGNGQREFLRSVAGRRRANGVVKVRGRQVKLKSVGHAIQAGINSQSGDRAVESIFPDVSVTDNSTVQLSSQLGPAGTSIRKRRLAHFEGAASQLGIVATTPDQAIGQLSGGNQQKAVIARSLLAEPTVVIVDEPTQGVDAPSRLDLYRTLRAQAEAGAAVLINSSDSGELAGLCDRVYVLSRGRTVAELSGDDLTESRIVREFVASTSIHADTSTGMTTWERLRNRVLGFLSTEWAPSVLLAILIALVSAFVATESDTFFTEINMRNLLMATVPLAILAIGQQLLLMSGGFDFSIGSQMSLTVVMASMFITSASVGPNLIGIGIALAVGLAVGLTNAFIVRGLRINAIVASIGMLGVVQGIAALLRPTPEGVVSLEFYDLVHTNLGFLPVLFAIVVVVAVLAEVARLYSFRGLVIRAIGYNDIASRRSGVAIERTKVTCFVINALFAVVAGLVLATEVGVGSNNVGATYALPTFAACFLGGAVLTGGKGSFVGVLLAAFLLMLLINVAPLIGLPSETSQVITGAMMILAIVGYALSDYVAKKAV